MAFSLKWQLENIFSGGSASPAFKEFLNAIAYKIFALQEQLKAPQSIKEIIQKWEAICEDLCQASAFVACLTAQDVNDKEAERSTSEITELQASFSNVSEKFDIILQNLTDQEFAQLLEDEAIKPISFPLTERREKAAEKLSLEQEILVNELSIDGYHAWSELYNSVIGQVKIPLTEHGEKKHLSWGQAYNRLSDPQRAIRQEIFVNSNHIWKEKEYLFGPILNHMTGFRLKVYEKRNWPILKEALDCNRISQETLDTMWKVVDNNKAPFIECLHHKATLLGLNKLSWFDLEAPVFAQEGKKISWDEAASFVIGNFEQFSPKMAAFAKRAFQQKWIEAEDRPGKRPGGFCTDLPLSKESRIFMTFSGTPSCLFTLAHELGHAFHNEVIHSQPEMARHYPMSLAETASTFAEMLVSEAAYQHVKDLKTKQKLLEEKLQRSIAYLLNIHSRYLFDTRFHEERTGGEISGQRLCQLMQDAQSEAYHQALEEYHPYFWASKTHFNSSDLPFYNFPYTFGYLFSLGIYIKATKDEGFEDKYIKLLLDSGSMTVETLARKHLNEDITKESFWQETLDFLKKDAEEFLKINISRHS